jgi:diaminohydroxyphosphoribosylaminopyrimidine deaminase/5-amino-6-(5-phosphoribosylamino)uracil reductase
MPFWWASERRLDSKKGADPVRIVLDTRLSISPDARILKLDSNSDTILVTGNTVSEAKKKKVAKKGVRLIVQPVKNGQIDMKPLMVLLGSMGITSLLVEGGSRVIAQPRDCFGISQRYCRQGTLFLCAKNFGRR